MRKEIYGIFLFFLVIFTLLSLVSYDAADPSLFKAKGSGEIQNLFGYVGAHLSGLLNGLFGLGAFWFPFLLLLLSFHFFRNQKLKNFLLTLFGGFLLIIATGSLLTLNGSEYHLFGTTYSAGGVIGSPLKTLLVRYSNVSGAIRHSYTRFGGIEFRQPYELVRAGSAVSELVHQLLKAEKHRFSNAISFKL